MEISPSVGYHPDQKIACPCRFPNRRPHIGKKCISIAFRKILPKILPAAYIFSITIMTNLKKLIENKSSSTKQCPARLSLRIIPLNLYEIPGDWGEYQPTYKNLLIYPTGKTLLNKFTSSDVKSVILCSSNRSFHLITLYNLYLQL